jgi:hypothetical protein
LNNLQNPFEEFHTQFAQGYYGGEQAKFLSPTPDLISKMRILAAGRTISAMRGTRR